MIVSVHQPHLLPWMGYFNKILHSDVFVVLDDVQFRKNYYQNRTEIKNPFNNKKQWLTIPVHSSSTSLICDVSIASSAWKKKILPTIEQCYSKAEHFQQYWTQLVEAFSFPTEHIAELNFHVLQQLLDMLNINNVKVIQSSSLDLGDVDNSNNRLVRICKLMDASYYIAGKGGKNYIDTKHFEDNDIKIIWQDFNPDKVIYPQVGGPYVAGVSIIDSLFNIGNVATVKKSYDAWRPEIK
jgi:hypothetical protein